MRQGTYMKGLQKLIDKVNMDIAQDELWQGRFEGGIVKGLLMDGVLRVYVRFVDKTNGYYKDTYMEYAPFLLTKQYEVWRIANDFICDYAKVNTNDKDYRKVRVNSSTWRAPLNTWRTVDEWLKDSYT